MRIPPSFPLWRLVSGSLVSTKPVVIGATGDVELTTDGLGGLLVNEAAVGGGSTSAATESAAGIVELATVAEVQTGTDTERCVTPAGASATYAALAGATFTGDVEVAAAGTIYFGPAATDGTWKIVRSTNDLSFQRREAGSYVEKLKITAA
jgi:hypothetical protein